MKKYLLAISFFTSLCYGQTLLYVDPNYTGGGNNGSSAHPWLTLAAGSGTINTALATNDVTVFFPARLAASNVSVTDTTAWSMSRTDVTSHVLLLDGIDQYDTTPNTANATWVTSAVPTSTNWKSLPKFTITANLPFDSNDSTGAPCRTGIYVKGIHLISTNGAIMNFAYIKNGHIQYLEGERQAGGAGGPGLYIGPANQGPGCSGDGLGVPNLLVEDVWIHDTWGECLYIGASTPDPVQVPTPNQLTEDPTLGNCMPNCHTGDNYVIQRFTFEACGNAGGGDGDGIDVKDGHTNLTIRNGSIRPTLRGGGQGHGIVAESATLIDSVYIEAPYHNCITAAEGWDTAPGRGALSIRNTICTGITGGGGHENGIDVFSPNNNGSGYTVTSLWGPVTAYNNSFNVVANNCILLEAGSGAAGFFTAENNIFDGCTSGAVSGGSLFALHDYDDYFGSGACTPGVTETHGICSDPKFISATAPYADINFKLQSSSPAGTAGLNLSGTFTLDYFNILRHDPWSMGAAQLGFFSILQNGVFITGGALIQ